MVNIRDVAARAAVAPMTVSRVLNNPDAVSVDTRKRVEEAIADLHYVPNMVGQGLRKRRTMVLGLVVSDITNPFAVQQIQGVTKAARAAGYTVIFAHTEHSADEELHQLRSLIERRVDGVLLSPVYNTPDSVEFVQRQRRPIAVLGYDMAGLDVDVVRCDTDAAARSLTEFLIDLGHRSIAMLSGSENIVTAVERARGYTRAMTEAGLGVRITYGRFTPESGYEMAMSALRAPERPTALVTASNFIALGAAEAASALGLRVPEDLSITTFDNARTDLVHDPFFTGIVQPVAEMASAGTDMVIERASGQVAGPGRDRIFPTTFEVHRSTAPPSREPASSRAPSSAATRRGHHNEVKGSQQ
ncbi:LacI family DNA-binding transcriptional regulator [Microbacterium sp. SSW1-59]|uniref:LacI family DNA-binding transcriptional regulator n=1 Tax=Microbacterium xanthum TaxID=3079794 RepID=UPI002AD444DD|nr:LacI family DNA-binding transcriptional regulator [Microbacterium sp. SSW1-59]MDZ8200364.1 LacI family DNA-binding transcriptional regulator [Microbacterium sp. SSW1-59]